MNFAGGPAFWIVALLAAAALALFFERFMELRRAHVDWQDFVKGVFNVLESGNETEALALCEDTPVPVANLTATAIRHRGGDASALRDAIDAQGRADLSRLGRRIASISVLGRIAPLVGLLGTLTGFARAVMLVEESPIVPKSDLVSAAAVATADAAAGVAAAICTAVLYAALRARLDRIAAELEAAASDVFARLASSKGEAK